MFLLYLVSFILILTIVVFIHELGHYAVAKLCGVDVKEFSIGFGKELFGWNDKSGTRWKVSMWPLGGYVKMAGDVDPASTKQTDLYDKLSLEDKKKTFFGQPLKNKAAIVFAGPLANFLLGIVLMTFMFSYYGLQTTTSKVDTVTEGGPAQIAGIKPGDIITSVDGSKVSTFSDMMTIIGVNTGTPVEVIVNRNGKDIKVIVTPKKVHTKDIFGNDVETPLIGIGSSETKHEKLGLLSSVKAATSTTYDLSVATLTALKQIVIGERSVKEMTGPIGIAKYSGQAVQHGLVTFLWFIVILTVNLGITNLLPIPVLDGGHLFFYGVQAIIRRPIPTAIQQGALKVGFALIIALSVFVIFNDILKLAF